MEDTSPLLRVWWIPQVPMKPFYYPVKDIETAKILLDVLALYDKFQYKNNVKPNYSNAGGLEEWDAGHGGGWIEYYDEEERDIDDIIQQEVT